MTATPEELLVAARTGCPEHFKDAMYKGQSACAMGDDCYCRDAMLRTEAYIKERLTSPPMTELECAIEIPMSDCGLTINCGRDGTWLHFTAKSGKCASINVQAWAEERSGFIVKRALLDWASDRHKQAALFTRLALTTASQSAPAPDPRSYNNLKFGELEDTREPPQERT